MKPAIAAIAAILAMCAARPAVVTAQTTQPAGSVPFFDGRYTNFEQAIHTFSTGVLAEAKGVAAGDNKHVNYTYGGPASVSVPPNPELVALQEVANMRQTHYGFVGGAGKNDAPSSLDTDTPVQRKGGKSDDQLLDQSSANSLTPTIRSSPGAIQATAAPAATSLDNPGMTRIYSFGSP